jgi:hypothetical protein
VTLDIQFRVEDKKVCINDFVDSVNNYLAQLKRENEKLASINHKLYDRIDELFDADVAHQEIIEKLSIDSVVLDKIINVVEACGHEFDCNIDIHMKEIANIIEERGD